ncbi:tryptophan-rich sensory protein [Rhodococcus sp. ARC_M5]|uniref:tryptophan-rich sensory protein n=1 Tax=Rhodococcus sp. ARC_M5 TaxID=2928851 RepID=UPI001FB1C094|nr:tryptophan-rich sensory protein [Rhodococcus sp. ARC_M5]MCJ0892141.1 tryptophan-rich sensory protein [Rhodococcus sp. ARC_M5]
MKIGVVVSAVVAVVVSFLGSGAWIGTPIAEAAGGALSATSTLVAPAGPAFSIWSVIYTGLIVYAVWQFLPGRTARHDALRAPIIASMLLNPAWILAIQFGQVWLSVVVIVALLAVLVRVFVLMQQHRAEGVADAVITDGTMGLYLGWVCVATIANISAWLVSLGVTGAATIWAIAVLVVAAAVGVLLARYSGGAIAPMLAIVWGLAWLAQGRLAGEVTNTTVGRTAVLAASVVALATVGIRLRSQRATGRQSVAA